MHHDREVSKSNRWQRVRALFERGLDARPEDHTADLDDKGGEDTSLLAEVKALLRSHKRAGRFLETPLGGTSIFSGEPSSPATINAPRAKTRSLGEVWRIPDLGSPSPTASEEARQLLQSRICVWTFWVCALSLAFFVVNISLWTALEGGALRILRELPSVLHLSGMAFAGAVSLATQGRARDRHVLRRLDAAAVLGTSTCFVFQAAVIAASQASAAAAATALYSGLFSCIGIAVSHAAVVPSDPRRTLTLSIFGTLPLVPALLAGSGTLSQRDSLELFANIATWAGIGVVIATVNSSVVFGLRREAAQIRRLGRYTLEEKIGGGGMGVVYRARHVLLRRPTAVKLLLPGRTTEADVVRFEREVQMTAQLSHPNTVAIYDYGRTPDGTFYYAMEYLEGVNLEQLVERFGAQPPERVIHILIQVCGALSEAHRLGLIHRDIKPANIILTSRGGEHDVAKVVDFGLVKEMALGEGARGMTAPGAVMGTPNYTSPEAVRTPDAVDVRSDLYSLGATAYFLLTARPLFEAPSAFELLWHHVHTDVVPPSQRSAMIVPPDLEALVLRCLRKDPTERPPDAERLRQDLHRCASAGAWTADRAAEWWLNFGATPEQTIAD